MSKIALWSFTELEDMKNFLGVTGDDDNDLLIALINGSSGFVEAYTDRKLKSTSYDKDDSDDRKFTWYDGDNTGKLFLREYPVTAVSAVEVSGATIAAASSTDYYGSTGYLLYRDRGEVFYENGFDLGKQNVRVSYTAGYAATDREWYELQDLCRSLVGWTYNNRQHLGFKSERLLNYAYTRSDIRETWQKQMLNRYRRKIFK